MRLASSCQEGHDKVEESRVSAACSITRRHRRCEAWLAIEVRGLRCRPQPYQRHWCRGRRRLICLGQHHATERGGPQLRQRHSTVCEAQAWWRRRLEAPCPPEQSNTHTVTPWVGETSVVLDDLMAPRVTLPLRFEQACRLLQREQRRRHRCGPGGVCPPRSQAVGQPASEPPLAPSRSATACVA